MLARFWNLFRRKRLDLEFEAELRHHLESLEAEHRARGLKAEEARLAARRDFGGLGGIQEAYRDQRGIPMLETLLKDIQFSLRSMWRTPVATIAVVATLAIGIGANTTIFSVVNGVLLKPLPYPDADRLITVAHAAPGLALDDSRDVGSSAFLYFTERELNRTFDGVGLFGLGTATVTGQGEPDEVRRLFVTSDILPMLGIEPLQGRYFSERDDAPGSANTIVLTYGFWQSRFGGDPLVVGRSLAMDDQSWNIIGVMPQTFRFMGREVDVISPLRIDRNQTTVGFFFARSIARLKPGVTLDQASADVRRMIPIAIDSFPLRQGTTRESIQGMRLAPRLRPIKQDVVGNADETLWVLMGTVGMLLLIACANVANLILARTEARQQELSIRAALGAGWGRIARGLLTESAVLSICGGVLGVGLSFAGLGALLATAPANLPRVEEIAIDYTALLFALIASLGCGLFFGAIPVVRYSRPGLATALRSGGRSSSARERLRARGVLVVAEVALALVLLICAGLMIRTFRELNGVNPGFADAAEVQTVQVNIRPATAPDPEAAVRKQQEILERLSAVPGVTSAAYTSAVPMGGGFTADMLIPEGKTFEQGNPPRARQLRFISPALLETLRIPLVAGRDFTWADIYERRPVVLISENLARLEWGGAKEALGKRVRGSGPQDQWFEIVGVAGSVQDRGLMEETVGILYIPILAERVYGASTHVWRSVTYVVRSPRTGAPAFLDELRQAVWAVDSSLPLTNVRTMSDILDASLARTSFTLAMLATAGAMALLLGMIGIYGVISYGVSQRIREIGIRIALGAERRKVQRMFLRQGLALTSIGVVIGLAAAAALTRLMSSLLFKVSPLDPLTYVGVSAALILAAALASYLPSRRASRVDPIDSLRAE